MDRGVAVVAVAVTHRIAGGQIAEARGEDDAVAIVVVVEVEVGLARIGCARIVVVGESVAVVVGVVQVADFGRAWVDRGVAVVAVGVVHRVASGHVAGARCRTSAVAVAVGVKVEVGLGCVRSGGVRVVRERVAVFVGVACVADFSRGWVDRCVAVVAVGVVRHTANGLDAGEHARPCAKEIAVAVEIERGRVDRLEVALGFAVTVVVDAIVGAVLDSAGVGRGVAVVAINRARQRREIARVGRAGAEEGSRVDRVAVEILITVEGDLVGCVGGDLSRIAVAVIVDGCIRAEFRSAGVDRTFAVVAVRRARERREVSRVRRAWAEECGHIDRRAVEILVAVESDLVGSVGVDLSGVAVAVVVDCGVCAQFGRAGVDVGDVVVAVGIVRRRARQPNAERHANRVARAVPVAVGVGVVNIRGQAVVEDAVAVLIDLVADFSRARVNRIVRVVTVAVVRHLASDRGAGALACDIVRAEGVEVSVGVVQRRRTCHRERCLDRRLVVRRIGDGDGDGVRAKSNARARKRRLRDNKARSVGARVGRNDRSGEVRHECGAILACRSARRGVVAHDGGSARVGTCDERDFKRRAAAVADGVQDVGSRSEARKVLVVREEVAGAGPPDGVVGVGHRDIDRAVGQTAARVGRAHEGDRRSEQESASAETTWVHVGNRVLETRGNGDALRDGRRRGSLSKIVASPADDCSVGAQRDAELVACR